MKALLRLFAIPLLGYAAMSHVQAQLGFPAYCSTEWPDEDTAIIAPGNTVAEIPFTVQTLEERFFLRAVAPINGVTISVISPSGAVFIPSGDSRISFAPGHDGYNRMGGSPAPPILGGTFTVDEIKPDAQGIWRTRFNFPPVAQKTRIWSRWSPINSPYHICLQTDDSSLMLDDPAPLVQGARLAGRYVAGDTGNFTVFGRRGLSRVMMYSLQPRYGWGLEDGVAEVNSHPQLTVQLMPSGTPVTVPMKDDGTGRDGRAGDGMFSGSYRFGEVGIYRIKASVTLQASDGPVVRTVERWVKVIEPTITLDGASIEAKGDGCAESLGVRFNMTAKKAGIYYLDLQLVGPDGTAMLIGGQYDFSVGAHSVLIDAEKKHLREKFSYASPITIDSVRGRSEDAEGYVTTEFKKYDIGVYEGGACHDLIEIGKNLTVTEVMQGEKIGALNFSFPVYVTEAGNYDISFNIIDPNGMPIGRISSPRTLSAGNNVVVFEIPGEKFSKFNGPYRVSGVVVMGTKNAIVALQLTPTAAYSASQFVQGKHNGSPDR